MFTDLFINILSKSMHIVDLKSGILNLSKAWMDGLAEVYKVGTPSKYIKFTWISSLYTYIYSISYRPVYRLAL